MAIHCSRACDVAVTASLRRGRRLHRIASFYETESQITKPYSQIVLRWPHAAFKARGRSRSSCGLLPRTPPTTTV